eukprot:CAMPEP_0197438526 /NCGR_PEP_ID=MMETSP1175-20131217/5500_1 /TAXON_ID=1003142 /ORGANISM="Triceratium dubium, Strain CCMP147" /LENGTH=200 /DNA_ID=CAMNT_0042968277 /DNA_START=178 /DNA_END=780 /DNA_ORIENTATION=-
MLRWTPTLLVALGVIPSWVSSFQPIVPSITSRSAVPPIQQYGSPSNIFPIARRSSPLYSRLIPDRSDPTADTADNPGDVLFAIQSDEIVLGISGTVAALIVFYSEYTLSQTGCGLPAGPLGVFGAVEGLSYLEVAGIFILSLSNKMTTGSGLPAGKYGALGAAEGLSFLAVFGGVAVLAYQIIHYGYIPNAIPMEGGMCQ